MKLKTVAAALSLVDGLWTVVAGAEWRQIFGIYMRSHVSDNLILMALGVVLVIDALVCFRGVLEAFYVSVVLAVIAVVGMLSWGVQVGNGGFLLTLVLAAATIVVDLLAARRKTWVPEEDHPLNLPVFG